MKTNKNLFNKVFATIVVSLSAQLIAMEPPSPKGYGAQGSKREREEETARQPGKANAKKGRPVSAVEDMSFNPQALEMMRWDNQQDPKVLTLQSSDGQDFVVPVHTAQLSETIRNLIEDAGTDHPIPLPNVDGKTLATIIELLPELEWLMAQSGRLPTAPENGVKYVIKNDNYALQQDELLYIPRAFQPIVDEALQNSSDDEVVDLFLAANYLDIPFILNGAAAVLADRLIKRSHPTELLYTTKEESLNLRLINLGILADKTAPNEAQEDAKTYFRNNKIDFVTRIPKDLLQKYVIRHVVLRRCGITQEYSIADYIREHGEPTLELGNENSYNEGKLELNLKTEGLTSLFGIQLLKQETMKTADVLILSDNCFFNFSLDPQGVEKPFEGFTNLWLLELNQNQLVELNSQLFSGLARLERLELFSNKFTQINPLWFVNLEELNMLDLGSNKIARINLLALCSQFKHMETLLLNDNQLTSLELPDNPTAEMLKSLELDQLNLENNQFSRDEKNRIRSSLIGIIMDLDL